MTRRGFIGLVASALGASALPSLGWFEGSVPAPSVAADVRPVTMVYFAATAGRRGGRIQISQGGVELISMAVSALNKLEWYGRIPVGPREDERLSVEIEGDITWRGASNDGRSFAWLGEEIIDVNKA